MKKTNTESVTPDELVQEEEDLRVIFNNPQADPEGEDDVKNPVPPEKHPW